MAERIPFKTYGPSIGVDPGCLRGRDPQILDWWIVGIVGGRGGRERVVKQYYLLSCTGSMSKVVTFEAK